MSGDIKFTIRTDSSSVVEGLNSVSSAAVKTGKHTEEVGAAAQKALSNIVEMNKAAAAAWKEQATALMKEKELLRQNAQAAKWTKVGGAPVAGEGGSPVTGAGGASLAGRALAGLGAARLVAGGAVLAGVTAAGAGVWSAAKQADALEKQQNRVIAAAGGEADGRKVIDQLSEFGLATGNNPTDLMKQAAFMMQGGVGSKTAVETLKGAVIAAAGDWEKARAITEKFTEMAAKGWVEEGALGAIEQQGVNVRAELQKMLEMNQQELQKAISDKQIKVEHVAAALTSATAAGTQAREAFDANLNTMDGAIARFKTAWGDLMETIGSYVTDGISFAVDRITDGVKELKGGVQWIADLIAPDAGRILDLSQDDLKALEETRKKMLATFDFSRGQLKHAGDDLPRHVVERALPDEKALLKLPETLKNNIETFSALQEKAKETLGEIDMQKGTLEDRRAAVQQKYALADFSGGSAGLQKQIEELAARKNGQEDLQRYNALLRGTKEMGLDSDYMDDIYEGLRERREKGGHEGAQASDLLRSYFQLKQAYGGVTFSEMGDKIKENAEKNAVSQQDILTLNQALGAKKALEELEKQEAALEKIRQEEEDRKQLLEATIAGDRERLELLEAQAAALKLVEEYQKAGMGIDEAQRRAAAKVDQEKQLKEAQQKLNEPKSPKANGWIQSGASALGGGNLRVRDVDVSMQQMARKTADSTASTATAATKIYEFLQQQARATTDKYTVLS